MPPRSWKLIAFCLSSVSTKTSAKAFTTRDISLETFASCFGVASGLSHSL